MNKKIIFVNLVILVFSVNSIEGNASSQNEDLCKEKGGIVRNFGDAYKHEYEDNCLNLNPELCSEIKGIWKDCIPPDCSGSHPCPTVICIGQDVCLLRDMEIYQQEIELQEFQKQITNVIIIGSVIGTIWFVFFIWRRRKIRNLNYE